MMGHDYHRIQIGGSTIFITPDTTQANWYARRLNMARESGLHTAMNILTEQLGLSEDYAKHIYHMLHEDVFMNHGGSTAIN